MGERGMEVRSGGEGVVVERVQNQSGFASILLSARGWWWVVGGGALYVSYLS